MKFMAAMCVSHDLESKLADQTRLPTTISCNSRNDKDKVQGRCIHIHDIHALHVVLSRRDFSPFPY